jgi:Zn-finger nucleic acid-binding protein
MGQIRTLLAVVLMAAGSFASAETMRFEDASGLLGASCARDIDANCRGVNLDAGRLKDCLARNSDSLSSPCRADYARAFDAIQKRVAAHSAAPRTCERDAAKLCGGAGKDAGPVLECLLAAGRGVSAKCSQALGEAGYR